MVLAVTGVVALVGEFVVIVTIVAVVLGLCKHVPFCSLLLCFQQHQRRTHVGTHRQ